MAESLETDQANLAQTKLDELLQCDVDVETLQKLLQAAIANKSQQLTQDPSASPASHSFDQNQNPKLENGIPENDTSEHEATNGEPIVPHNPIPQTEDGKPIANEDSLMVQAHTVQPTISTTKDEGFSSHNEGVQSLNTTKNQEELDVSQGHSSNPPGILAANIGALKISDTDPIATASDPSTSKIVPPVDEPPPVIDFDSVAPPISIPLLKIGQYLPKGKAITDTDHTKPIPLPLKPMLVIKGQTAAMVFELAPEEHRNEESDHGISKCKECGRNVMAGNPFEDNIEDNLTYNDQEVQLSVGKQNASMKNQDHVQMVLQNDLHGKQELQPNQPVQQGQGSYQQPFLQQHQPPPQKQGQLAQPQGQLPSPPQQQGLSQFPQQQQLHQHQQSSRQQEQVPHQHQPLMQHQQLQQGYMPSGPMHQQPNQYPNQPDYNLTSSPMPRSLSVPPKFDGSGRFLQENIHSSSPKTNMMPGLQPPSWCRDEEFKDCGHCGKPFTVTRRKHHCRGCGKIFCSECCSQLAQLPYLKFKIARICVICTQAIKKARAEKIKRQQQKKLKEKQRRNSETSSLCSSSTMGGEALLYFPGDQFSSQTLQDDGVSISGTPNQSSNFMAPGTSTAEYSTAGGPTSNFMPNAEHLQSRHLVQDTATPHSSLRNINGAYSMYAASGGDKASSYNPNQSATLTLYDADFVRHSLKMPLRPAGKTITWTANDSKVNSEEQKKLFKNITKDLKSVEGVTIQTAVELSLKVKKIKVVVKQGLHEAWFLCSNGFTSCGQKEIAFMLEKRINEEVFPFEMLKIYRTIYSMTLNQGERFEHGNYLAFNSPLLGSEDNKGFLFVSSNMLPKVAQLATSEESLLCGFLFKQSEFPCAKYLPTRLLIALGVQQQCYPCPALSCRDRSSVCNIEPNEIFYSTFVAVNKFLNHKTPQAVIPGVRILKSSGKVALELPIAYQTEIISIFDSLFVDDKKPVTVPIAGDLVFDAGGHFVYSPSNMPSVRRGFVVLQNNNEQEELGNQYLAFSAILLVLSFGEECSSHTKFGVEVIDDGIKVTLAGSQAREIRQSVYQGTNCCMYVGNADSQDQFILRWTSNESNGSVIGRPKTFIVKQDPRKTGYSPAFRPVSPNNIGGQTRVVIDRVTMSDMEAAIQNHIVGDPVQAVRKLENDVRQACYPSLQIFANRMRPNAEKRLTLTLSLGAQYKKWSLGPTNQPITLARSLQLAVNEIEVPETNDEIVFVFNVILQKIN